MSKGVINTTVESEAKEGFVDSAKPCFGERGSTSRVIQEVGLALRQTLIEIRERDGELEPGAYDLQVRLVRRRKGKVEA